MSSNNITNITSKPFCNEHRETVLRIKRLEEERKDQSNRIEQAVTSIMKYALDLKELSINLKSLVVDFNKINNECEKVNSKLNDHDLKINTLESKIPEILDSFEEKIENKIKFLFGGIGIVIIVLTFMFKWVVR